MKLLEFESRKKVFYIGTKVWWCGQVLVVKYLILISKKLSLALFTFSMNFFYCGNKHAK